MANKPPVQAEEPAKEAITVQAEEPAKEEAAAPTVIAPVKKKGKALSALLSSDRVVVGFGPRTIHNQDKGTTTLIEDSKVVDVTYAYFETLTESEDDYNPENGYCKMIGRTVKLLGTASYEPGVSQTGEPIQVLVAVPFEEDEAE